MKSLKPKYNDSQLKTIEKDNKSEDSYIPPIKYNIKFAFNGSSYMTELHNIIYPKNAYNKIRYNSILYSIGDKLIITGKNENLFGELTNIIPNNGDKRYPSWPTIEVKWFYKKRDLDLKKNNLHLEKNFNSLSDYELFPTEHRDIIFIETILGKFEVVSFKEYESMKELSDKTFFTRANYDAITTHFLKPKFDEWEKECVCQCPLNPDQLYIKCDICNKWFHPECCGVRSEKVTEIKNFYCPNCSKEN